MRQSKFDRINLYLKRYSKAKIMGLRPSQLKGRSVGPKVILNSIPKGGTHLLDQLLTEFPLIRPSSKRTIRPEPENSYFRSGFNDSLESRTKEILCTGKGEFVRAHVPAEPTLLSAIDNAGDIKVLMIVRNPRSVVVSNFKYVSDIDTTHPVHNLMNQLNSDTEKLKACIYGIEGQIESIGSVYRSYSGWSESKSCLIVKFEDLVGAKGGGSDSLQEKTVKNIADFLNIPLSNKQLDNMLSSLKTPKSSTFRSGRIDGWKEYFDDELEAELDIELSGFEKKFGY